MQPTQWQPEPGVIVRLLDQPYRFSFAQLINLLLAALRHEGVPYEAALGNVIRFSNSVSLSFPASEVQALELEWKAGLVDAGKQAHERAMFANVKRIRITPAFIGLLGTSGTLPLHDSERLAAQQHIDRDASQHALIDVFSNRMIGLFYETWGKYRVEHGLRARGRDSLLPMLAALAGRYSGKTPSPADNTAAFYAGIVRARPVSAIAVEQILREHFSVPVRLEQFVGCWDQIAPRRRSTFGGTPIVLGGGATLGTRLWRHDMRARLHIGPLDEAQLARFLPGGSARRDLAAMMTMFAIPLISWEVRLLLAPPCVRRLTLSTRSAPRQLGWNSFLTGTEGVTKRAEMVSLLRLPSSGAPAG